MDSLTQYRQIIKRILTAHTKIPYSFGDLQSVTVFDTKADRYLLLAEGWEKRRRIHDCLIHIAIIDGKIWIQEDGTEYGVAQELLDAGVPKEKIVLGFKSPALRKYTEFAVA
jgi:hypothetical protein